MKSRGGLGTSLLPARFYFLALLFTSHRSPLSERLEQAILNQQDHQPLFKRAVSSEDLEVRGRVSSTKDEAA